MDTALHFSFCNVNLFHVKLYMYFYLCVCMHACAMVRMGKSKDSFQELVLSSPSSIWVSDLVVCPFTCRSILLGRGVHACLCLCVSE